MLIQIGWLEGCNYHPCSCFYLTYGFSGVDISFGGDIVCKFAQFSLGQSSTPEKAHREPGPRPVGGKPRVSTQYPGSSTVFVKYPGFASAPYKFVGFGCAGYILLYTCSLSTCVCFCFIFYLTLYHFSCLSPTLLYIYLA